MALCAALVRSPKHIDSLPSHFAFFFRLLSYSGLSWYHREDAGTIRVTLQISLHYSTHKVFKAHVKPSTNFP
jgi:hypothetical protein